MIRSIKFKKDHRVFKKDEEYTFKPGMNLLVGDQGSGKSTLIELLRSLNKKTFADFDAGDSSYRAQSISHLDKIEDIVEIDADPLKIVAFDFERESARDMSAIHHDMVWEQLAAAKASHGQGNLISIDRIMKQIKADQEKIGTVIFDEPDAAMSPRSCYGLVGMFNGIANKWGKQLIVAAHNPIVIRGVNPLYQKEPYWTEVLNLEDKRWEASEIFMILQIGPNPKAEQAEQKSREKTKRKSKKARNAYAIPAKSRKAGVIRPKSEKRKNGKNKQAEYLSENSN
jgi:predicted ATPase